MISNGSSLNNFFSLSCSEKRVYGPRRTPKNQCTRSSRIESLNPPTRSTKSDFNEKGGAVSPISAEKTEAENAASQAIIGNYFHIVL